MAQAIGSYAERFNGLEARLDATDMRIDYLAQDVERRFDAVDRRLDRLEDRVDGLGEKLDDRTRGLSNKIDNRFGWQTVFMAALVLIVLFDDAVRAAMGV